MGTFLRVGSVPVPSHAGVSLLNPMSATLIVQVSFRYWKIKSILTAYEPSFRRTLVQLTLARYRVCMANVRDYPLMVSVTAARFVQPLQASITAHSGFVT